MLLAHANCAVLLVSLVLRYICQHREQILLIVLRALFATYACAVSHVARDKLEQTGNKAKGFSVFALSLFLGKGEIVGSISALFARCRLVPRSRRLATYCL